MSYPPQPPQSQYLYHHIVRPPSNGSATAAMVLGIVGIVIGIWSFVPILGLFSAVTGFVPALLGVVFGHVGLGKARQLRGTGHSAALTGLILGYITLAVIVLVTVFWWLAIIGSSSSSYSY
ncbi:hypothetical protein SAMN04489806_1426 [Paramicrobacterium humi]|uniref:DUF4190 domain-containing protein n=1 Tax=Paramicrobacterium humi TaxID=640635 RepID=A0A1H4L604_9MICO|nr:DUF4190 domain-containing protein [Microbacterium humi]SEB65868.1 hypothetical protein SAMN04489806_1426 [Microbacterium humi]